MASCTLLNGMSSSSDGMQPQLSRMGNTMGPCLRRGSHPESLRSLTCPGRRDASFNMGKLRHISGKETGAGLRFSHSFMTPAKFLVPKVHPHGRTVYQPSTGSTDFLFFQKCLEGLLDLLRDGQIGLDRLSLISGGRWWEGGGWVSRGKEPALGVLAPQLPGLASDLLCHFGQVTVSLGFSFLACVMKGSGQGPKPELLKSECVSNALGISL